MTESSPTKETQNLGMLLMTESTYKKISNHIIDSGLQIKQLSVIEYEIHGENRKLLDKVLKKLGDNNEI